VVGHYTVRVNHKKQQKRQVSKLKIVLLIIVVAQIIALLWLYLSVGRYKNFWVDKASKSGELTYIALGDSAAQGIGASSPMRGYVGLIAKRLEAKTGKKVKIINVSVTGAKVEDVTRDQIPQIKGIKADLVTIEIGANDVRTFEAGAFSKAFNELLSKLPNDTYVSDMPLFNSRPSSTEPAKQASKLIRASVKEYPSLHQVYLEELTSANQSIFGFAPDLFHPNNVSYKNWADAFWNSIDTNRIH
jgi:acyl-CoA thioesterase-1